MKHYTADWFSRNIPVWQEVLKEFVGKVNLTALEVGVFEGMASNWLLKNILTAPMAKLYAIDTFMGSMETADHGVSSDNLREKYEKNTAEYRDKVAILQGKSQDLLKTFPILCDIIYIDGSHKATDVIQDLVLSWPLLKTDGILIIDDYDWRFYDDKFLLPYPAIDAFLSLYEQEYQLIKKDTQVIVRKK